MKTEKDQRWVPNGSIDLEPCGPGVARKILAYTDGVVHGCECLEEGILLDIFAPMREDFVS